MSKNKHEISLKDAAKMTKAFRTFPLTQLGTLLSGVKGYKIDKNALQALMDQEECVSVRFYLALNGILSPKLTLVAVGVDVNGNDILDLIMDDMDFCPPDCPEDNELNS